MVAADLYICIICTTVWPSFPLSNVCSRHKNWIAIVADKLILKTIQNCLGKFPFWNCLQNQFASHIGHSLGIYSHRTFLFFSSTETFGMTAKVKLACSLLNNLENVKKKKKKDIQWHLLKMAGQTLLGTITIGVGTMAKGF